MKVVRLLLIWLAASAWLAAGFLGASLILLVHRYTKNLEEVLETMKYIWATGAVSLAALLVLIVLVRWKPAPLPKPGWKFASLFPPPPQRITTPPP